MGPHTRGETRPLRMKFKSKSAASAALKGTQQQDHTEEYIQIKIRKYLNEDERKLLKALWEELQKIVKDQRMKTVFFLVNVEHENQEMICEETGGKQRIEIVRDADNIKKKKSKVGTQNCVIQMG